MRLLRHPLFLAVSLSHFSVDVLNGQMGVLLAALSAPLGLSNATIGLIATVYSIVALGLWIYPVAILAGTLNGASHSILVTMAQRSLPGRAALASGIILGFIFTAGALGTYLSGLAADRFGLAYALQINAVVALCAALLSLALLLEGKSAQTVAVPAGD